MKSNVLVTGKLHPDAIQTLERHDGLKLSYRPDCSRDELERLISTAHVLISRSETDVDRDLLLKAKDLKLIARAAVGVGNIDLDCATERGILVVNAPGKNTNSAAELTMGLILAMLRKIPSAQATVKAGGWDRHRFTGNELRGKRIGIVGLGNVGHRVARFANGFDMEVLAYDPYIAPEVFQRHRAQHCRSLEELLPKIDILSLHVPLNGETKGMITQDLMRLMPRGGYVVNAARGGIASEGDMLVLLNEGHLAGVAIDTFVHEPSPMKDLVSHENVWCTPHIGASTDEAQKAIGETIVEQVIKILDGGVADYPVNLPELKVIDKPVLKSFAVLAEKLGSMAGQIVGFNPREVVLHYRGDIATLDHAIIRLSWMKGYAAAVVDDYVSFVNVNAHFEKLGLIVREENDPSFHGYKSSLTVEILGPENMRLAIGGVVFDEDVLRIAMVNDFHFEVEPRGSMLLIENLDRVGVVGNVGMFLAHHGVNISSFALSRNRQGGKAMSIIGVDNQLASRDIQNLRKLENIESVRFFRL